LLDKQEEQLLNQITEEMRSMRNHFIVVTLIAPEKGRAPVKIEDPVPPMSNEFIDTRNAFLEKCQMYHYQFDETRNAQHSTLMLLYYLHGLAATAKAKMAMLKPPESAAGATATEATSSKCKGGASGGCGGSSSSSSSNKNSSSSRSSKIEIAMHDWSQLLAHTNEAASSETWALPPEELFLRILAQINRSKRDILQEKYNQCRDPSTSSQTRSVFIRVLKRIAESFMSCLLSMQAGTQPGQHKLSQQPSQSQTPQVLGS